MKKTKLVITSSLILSLALLVMSFSKDSAPGKRTTTNVVTYSYIAANKFIGPGHMHSLVESEVKAGFSWSNVEGTYSNNSYLAAITWDRDLLSKPDAISGVWEYYEANSYSLPADNASITVNGVMITIRRQLTNN